MEFLRLPISRDNDAVVLVTRQPSPREIERLIAALTAAVTAFSAHVFAESPIPGLCDECERADTDPIHDVPDERPAPSCQGDKAPPEPETKEE